jgi:hypothetical protein
MTKTAFALTLEQPAIWASDLPNEFVTHYLVLTCDLAAPAK